MGVQKTALLMMTPELTASVSAESQPQPTVEPKKDKPFHESFVENSRQLDRDAFINNFAIVAAVAGVSIGLYHIDASITHNCVDTLDQIAKRVSLEVWESYEGVLADSPIATKSATSATVYTIGDMLAQRSEGVSMGQLDRGRVLRSLLAGAIGHGPLSHYWYILNDS
jgi:hypothetical protein